jgi:hypothetical protein
LKRLESSQVKHNHAINSVSKKRAYRPLSRLLSCLTIKYASF